MLYSYMDTFSKANTVPIQYSSLIQSFLAVELRFNHFIVVLSWFDENVDKG